MTATAPSAEITVTKEGDRWVARPKVLRPGYVVVVAVSSKISEADAVQNLLVQLDAKNRSTGRPLKELFLS